MNATGFAERSDTRWHAKVSVKRPLVYGSPIWPRSTATVSISAVNITVGGGREEQMPLQYFFLPKNSSVGYWVEERQLTNSLFSKQLCGRFKRREEMNNPRLTGQRMEASASSHGWFRPPPSHTFISRLTLWPAPYRGSSASIQDQSMWDLWRIKWHWYRIISQYFGLPCSVSQHQCSILIFILVLLLSEGQAGEGWKPSKKCSLGLSGQHWREQCFNFVVVIRKVEWQNAGDIRCPNDIRSGSMVTFSATLRLQGGLSKFDYRQGPISAYFLAAVSRRRYPNLAS